MFVKYEKDVLNLDHFEAFKLNNKHISFLHPKSNNLTSFSFSSEEIAQQNFSYLCQSLSFRLNGKVGFIEFFNEKDF